MGTCGGLSCIRQRKCQRPVGDRVEGYLSGLNIPSRDQAYVKSTAEGNLSLPFDQKETK